MLHFTGGIKQEGKEKSISSIFKRLIVITIRYSMNAEKVKYEGTERRKIEINGDLNERPVSAKMSK